MKKLIWVVILIVLIGLGFWYFNKGAKGEIISPKAGEQVMVEKDTGPKGGQKVPKEFKFEASSDLGIELGNISPEILDSDFSELKTLIKDL